VTTLLTVQRTIIRRSAGLYAYENALMRAGFQPLAGADEAGRGACAGPLVVAAVILGRKIEGLADSKALTPQRREALFEIVMKKAQCVSVITIEVDEVDRGGVHRANIEGMRRAIEGLAIEPGYVLTDGFAIAGIGRPGLAVWKGDQVCASIAAASIVAKVTRDRIMVDLDLDHPGYGLAEHKGYITRDHQQALSLLGASSIHRRSFANVPS
jgi:ribonuclease HII